MSNDDLAVTLAKSLPKAHVTATDQSTDALQVAKANAAKHVVIERMRFLQGDLFGPVPAGETFDFVVSNPPYIPSAEIESLQIEVRDYDPRPALDGGTDGLDYFRRLAAVRHRERHYAARGT